MVPITGQAAIRYGLSVAGNGRGDRAVARDVGGLQEAATDQGGRQGAYRAYRFP